MHASSRYLVRSMEVFEVISIDVGGGDISAAPKPPLTWNAVPLLCLKVPAESVRALNLTRQGEAEEAGTPWCTCIAPTLEMTIFTV